MGDFANALVKFRVKPEFKNAFNIVFSRMKNPNLDYLDFGFDNITVDGEYIEEYDADAEYLNFNARIGCYFNLEGDFSIPFSQDIEDDIVTLCFSKKWSGINTLKYIIEDFLDCVAYELIFCEIIGVHKISVGEVYCRGNFVCEKNENNYNTFILIEKEMSRIYED